MTTIPKLAFTGNHSKDFDKAAYFAVASWFPSASLIPAVIGKPAIAPVSAYPARAASSLIPANPANPAILAGALFANSPSIAAGAAVPAFPAKPATPAIIGMPAVLPAAAVPPTVGIKPEILALTKYESTDTNSKFTVFVPRSLMREAMYGDKRKSILPWTGGGNINYVKADGIDLPDIGDAANLEEFLFKCASESIGVATVEPVLVNGNTYYKISRDTSYPDENPT